MFLLVGTVNVCQVINVILLQLKPMCILYNYWSCQRLVSFFSQKAVIYTNIRGWISLFCPAIRVDVSYKYVFICVSKCKELGHFDARLFTNWRWHPDFQYVEKVRRLISFPNQRGLKTIHLGANSSVTLICLLDIVHSFLKNELRLIRNRQL